MPLEIGPCYEQSPGKFECIGRLTGQLVSALPGGLQDQSRGELILCKNWHKFFRKSSKIPPWARHSPQVRPGDMGDTTYLRHG